MADERLRTKRELKRLFTNLKRKGISDDMISILIDTLWRDRVNLRTSGFFHTGAFDAQFSFNVETRIFSIIPFDPLVEGFEPRYSIFSWSNLAVHHRIFTPHEIVIPNEEGLFCVYFDKEPDPGTSQVLAYKKNPTPQELEILYISKVLISCFYWDAANNELLHFGNDKHGSEWNPQLHWFIHTTQGAKRKSGLQFTGYSLNGDGSSNDHAKFNITGGVMLHDDFEMTIPTSSNSIPVLYSFGTYPRFLANNGYAFAGAGRVYFNSGQISLAQADSGNFVLYHIFATNEILTESRKIISVMGIAQYTTLADAFQGVDPELDSIVTYMPQQGRCYLGTVIYQTADDLGNDVNVRIIAITGNQTHPPVSIAPGSEEFLSINEKQELAYNSTALNETIAETIETNNNTTVQEIIQSSVGFSRESWLTEDTSLTEITQLSSWYVIAFNELVGNFKATVMVRDKVTNAIFTLQNTFGFDYTNVASEVGDDNAIISDGSISLVLSVDTATDKLKAVISGMTSNAKRIHFCFERCVLSKREIELAGTADMALSMEGVIDSAMELAGTSEMGIGMEADIDSALKLEGTSEIGVGMEGELIAEEEETVYPVEYGLLYNWYAATDVRNIAASGWHVMSFEEGDVLVLYVGGTTIGGSKLKETGLIYWNSPNSDATNEYNFNFRGTGRRRGLFEVLKTAGYLITPDLSSSNFIGYRLLASDGTILKLFSAKYVGFSMRLVNNNTLLSNGQTGTYTGNDGKVYRTICINGVEFTADILCETRFRDGSIIPWYGANAANYFTDAEWIALVTPGCAAYANTLSNVAAGFTFPT